MPTIPRPRVRPTSYSPTRPSFPHVRQYHAVADNDMETGSGRFSSKLRGLAQQARSATTQLGELNTRVIRADINPEFVAPRNQQRKVGRPNLMGWLNLENDNVVLNPKNDTQRYPGGSYEAATPEWKDRTQDQQEETVAHEGIHLGLKELRKRFPRGAGPEGSELSDVTKAIMKYTGSGLEHGVIKGLLLLSSDNTNDSDSPTAQDYTAFLKGDSESLTPLLISLRRNTVDVNKPKYWDRTNNYLREAYQDWASIKKKANRGIGLGKGDPDVAAMGDTVDEATDGDLTQFLFELRDSVSALDSLAGDETALRVLERVKQAEANESE